MESVSDKLRAAFVSAMEAHRGELERRGITFKEVEYDVRNSGNKTFSSEVRVTFFQSGELVDIFEFHLFRDGEQVVTAKDIDKWVEENIVTVGD